MEEAGPGRSVWSWARSCGRVMEERAGGMEDEVQIRKAMEGRTEEAVRRARGMDAYKVAAEECRGQRRQTQESYF